MGVVFTSLDGSMPPAPHRLTDLPSTNPAAAYAADVMRVDRISIGTQDDCWLILTHALSRFAQLSAEELCGLIPETADSLAVSALALGLPPSSRIMRAARALRRLHDDSSESAGGSDAVSEIVLATQGVGEELEIAGGFALAHAMLAGLLSAFERRMSSRMRGNVIAQQGRALRQLGVTDAARDHYTVAMQQGYDCDAKDVVARALLGLAVIGLTRGNYPAAREQFERALANADLANDPDLIRSAHHGLMNCGFASGDLDAAMVHGWNVLRLCIAPDSRAEALMNMAEICRLTGEHDAALRVFVVAVEWTSVPRVRLHALSGALSSAVTLGRLADARRYAATIADILPDAADAYTRASITIEVADSMQRLGEAAEASSLLSEALAIATSAAFHELVHRAEQMAAQWQTTVHPVVPGGAEVPHRKPRRSEHFRTVLRSLNGLTAASL